MNRNSKLHNLPLILFGMFFVMLVGIMCLINGGFILTDYEDSVAGVREEARRTNIVEGNFYDRNGAPVMTPEVPVKEALYRVDGAYAHLLGYNSNAHLQSGLRNLYHNELYTDLGTGKGASIQLTIDDELQKQAYGFLQKGVGGSPIRGSIVVLDAKTCDVLAMTSRNYMEFDTSLIDEKYKAYSTINEFFYNYPTDVPEAPGSVYKLVTACAAIENGVDDHIYNDVEAQGKYYVDKDKELEIINHKAVREIVWGDINMQLGLNQSLNTYFASVGLEKLGEGVISEYADRFLINREKDKKGGYKTLDVGFAKLPSYYEITSPEIAYNERYNLALLTHGQGRIALTPLHMAMIGQAIANNGDMRMPMLVKNITYPDGKEIPVVREDKPEPPIKAETAEKLKNYLVNTTRTIFKKELNITDKDGNPVRVYSKTGTAELGLDNSDICHAYLMCMTDDYVVLISSNRTTASGSSHSGIAEALLRALYK